MTERQILRLNTRSVLYVNVILTSLVFEELQTGSSYTQLDHDRDQSELPIQRFLPIDRNSVRNT